jgi:hypothetical protein
MPGRARRAAPRTIYEATEDGVDHFEAWMLGSSPTPPLRDELHMKIALCQPHNLPRLIDMVHGQELACLGGLRDLRQIAQGQPANSQEWSRLMRVLARDAEFAFWNARIEWLQNARELLEQLRDELERSKRHIRLDADAGLRTIVRSRQPREAERSIPRA